MAGRGRQETQQKLTHFNSSDALAKLRAADTYDENSLCEDRHVAQIYDFMASQWLPIKEEGDFHTPHQPGGLTYTDVDWDSVMMYDTKGGLAVMPDILLRNDGQRLNAHFRPSPGDVHGVRRIYGEDEGSILEASFPGLPNTPKDSDSSFWNNRKNAFKEHMRTVLNGCSR